MSSRKAPKMGQRRKTPTKAKGSIGRPSSPAPKVLHCHSTFAAGGKELRAVQLMNAFGKALDHSIVSGDPAQMAAKAHVGRQVSARFPKNFPSLTGFPSPGRLAKIAKALKPYDLILTYNWGAMDVAMAHSVFARNMDLPPLIHHEDGFNEDEAVALKKRRNLYRQAALRRASALIVPSVRLEQIALHAWAQPRDKVFRISNGIDTKAFGKPPKPGALRLSKRDGEMWVGSLAGLRAVKQLDQLVQAVAGLPENWHLVILGEGPERDRIRWVSEELDVDHRVHLPGAVSDPSSVVGLFDIFALSSASEQFPLSVVEAMAAGLPVVAPDVGDIATMVAEENRPFIAPAGDIAALADRLERLATQPDLGRKLGKANQAKARLEFDHYGMIETYRAIYSKALGREF